MVSKKIKINIEEVSANTAFLEVELDGKKQKYEAGIVNSQGVFGLELPAELTLLLREFPFETKKLVGRVREEFAKNAELQAA